jgi:hypothetical protein
MSELRPEHGVRIVFDRVAAEGTSVEYDVALHAPSGSFGCRVRLEGALETGVPTAFSDGAWSPLGEPEGQPERWMVEAAAAFLRQLHRNHAGSGDWPRRWSRWRDRRR